MADTATLTRIDMYHASIPTVLAALKGLKACLAKAEAWAAEKKVKEDVLLSARLALDMFPLVRQIQLATDNAKGIAARLGNVENPSYADDEKTLEEINARLQKTIDFVQSVPQAGFDGAESREIVLKFPNLTMEFTGLNYLTSFAIPNFFFHVTTAYAILRHSGVPLGKPDFLGSGQ